MQNLYSAVRIRPPPPVLKLRILVLDVGEDFFRRRFFEGGVLLGGGFGRFFVCQFLNTEKLEAKGKEDRQEGENK